MRKRSRIVLVALGLVLLGTVAWKILGPQEPSYQGKSLSTWLHTYQVAYYGNGHQETDEAIRHMGTNVIPTLLKLLRANDPPPAIIKCMQFAEKLPILKIHFDSTAQKHNRAMLAFYALGSEAKQAVPQLIEIYERNPGIDSQRDACAVLGNIGPPAKEAVSALLRNITNKDEYIRLHTIVSLGRIHAEPELVVPALIKSLDDTVILSNSGPIVSGQAFAVMALKEYGTNAKPAVPALMTLFNSKADKSVKDSVTNALISIDPEAAAKAGVK